MWRHNMLLLLTLIVFVKCDMVPLKVLNELPNQGYSGFNSPKSEDKLKLRMQPANFSGPDYLEKLIGKCFKHRDPKYEYVFCPFHNITQEDIQAFYEPYKGVLGVWGQWDIKDNQFAAMEMLEGSGCSAGRHRSTRVAIKCGKVTQLESVTEPDKCRYAAVFKTPLVCGINAMVVYPRLDAAELRERWDEASTDLYNQEITQLGYDNELERIFQAAGLRLSPSDLSSLMQSAQQEDEGTEEAQGGPGSCQERLTALQTRVQELEEEVKVKEEKIVELVIAAEEGGHQDD
ncbi:unnamed protein product [Meganyctiphanes norvegica]|uniref:MRH domain-containing protein n=1 Tax=Meganyctiphanes norvegica TaxID=48144 RepID=A0AAV2RGZ8_MEGNR